MAAELDGMKLEKYTLLTKLSEGGMAWVYLAEHALLKKKVAVKILLPDLARNKSMVERFLREARAAAGLNHHNIIKIYDVGVVDKIHFIAMDYIDGPRLTDYMEEKGILAEQEILRISRQVLEAIGEAHANHIVHRDLKPHNIMLDHRGEVVIMDFGIAKAAFFSDLTMTGAFVGTAKYASPEQVKGEKIAPSSDLYSWGVVMYEMATGQAPFTGKDVASLVYQHMNAPVTAPAQLNPDLSPELNSIILTCLEKAPENRFQSASEMLAQLDRLTAGRYATGPTPSNLPAGGTGYKTRIFKTSPAVKARGKRSIRRLGDWVLVGILSLLLATVLGWWLIRKYSIPAPTMPQQIATGNTSHSQPETDKSMLRVWTEKNRYRIGESIKIKFRMRNNGYLFLYHEDARGQGQVIFPMKMDQDNFLMGGLTYTLPDPNATFDFIVQPPAGTERIKALYTSSAEQADRWRKMADRELLTELKKQKDFLVFEVVN